MPIYKQVFTLTRCIIVSIISISRSSSGLIDLSDHTPRTSMWSNLTRNLSYVYFLQFGYNSLLFSSTNFWMATNLDKAPE
jgi:hypothetical protein